MNRSTKKLVFHRDTLRRLTNLDLQAAAGGKCKTTSATVLTDESYAPTFVGKTCNFCPSVDVNC